MPENVHKDQAVNLATITTNQMIDIFVDLKLSDPLKTFHHFEQLRDLIESVFICCEKFEINDNTLNSKLNNLRVDVDNALNEVSPYTTHCRM